MAPEVVNRRGHTQSADWWSFGVLMVWWARDMACSWYGMVCSWYGVACSWYGVLVAWCAHGMVCLGYDVLMVICARGLMCLRRGICGPQGARVAVP